VLETLPVQLRFLAMQVELGSEKATRLPTNVPDDFLTRIRDERDPQSGQLDHRPLPPRLGGSEVVSLNRHYRRSANHLINPVVNPKYVSAEFCNGFLR
jgi:hypothetical protein